MSTEQYETSPAGHMSDTYHEFLLAELEAREVLASAKVRAEYAKLNAEENAPNDGKNAEARKLQKESALANDPDYQGARVDVTVAEHGLALASINVSAYREEISLHRAWLYSLSGVGR